MEIPLVDLARQHEEIADDLAAAFERVHRASAYVLGPAVERFERRFADYVGTDHCVGTASGTAALHLALRALEVGEGGVTTGRGERADRNDGADGRDEVITTPFTFVSTAWAIRYVGARPVFADVEPDHLTLDPDRLAAAIGPRTRAVVPVDLYGHPARLEAIAEVAGRHDVPVVEDAAQAHGARWRGARCGTFGDLACFSFYPSKNLGAYGDAGAVTTDDERLATRIRRLRDHGQARRYVYEELAYNYRMDGLQGAVLDVKLDRLDGWNADRARVAERYRERLAGLEAVECPTVAADADAVHHLYVIRCPDRDARDGLRSHLERRGIATGLHYPVPLHLQPAFSALGHEPGDFPVAEAAADRVLSLPIFPGMTGAEVDAVCDAIEGHFGA